jgi:hypothetical protein
LARKPTSSSPKSAPPEKKSRPQSRVNAGNKAELSDAPSKDKPLLSAAKAALNDPLLHSLVSGLVISAAQKQGAKNGLSNTVIAFASTQLARKSMPGALLLGAGFLAKNWYDSRKEKSAQANGAETDAPDTQIADNSNAAPDAESLAKGQGKA